MTKQHSHSPATMLSGSRFKIGQDVHLKSGGPEMVVNRCTQDLAGHFVIDTIWFGEGGGEEHGSYREELLEAQLVPFHRRS